MENNEKTNETETTTVENLEITETGKKLSKREIALVVTAGLALGLVGLCLSPKTAKGEKVYNDIKNFFKITASEETNNNQTEGYSAEDYANMSVKYSQEELNEMTFEELNDVYTEYNATLQQDVFNLLESTQNKMNEETLPSIKLDSDGDKQLYLYAKEIIGTYIMVNADSYTNEHLVKIFGNSGLLVAEDVMSNYVQTARVMNTYYSRTTQRSGIANLFVDEDDKELVEKFEDMIVSYNKATTSAEKTEIGKEMVSYFEEFTDATKLDNPSKGNPGAVSYILTVGLPFAMENRFIDEQIYLNLIEINEVVTCDNLYNEVKSTELLAHDVLGTEPTGIYKVVAEPADPRAMDDKNVKDLDRNIAWGNYEQSNIKRENNYSDRYFSNVYSSETIRKEVTREEAVNHFGESQVKQTEENARQKVESGNQQAESDANDYQSGYNNGYAPAYNNAATNGTMISTSTSGSAKYQSGYSNGVVNGYNDGLVEYSARQQIINNPPQQEIIEQPVAPAIPEQQQPEPAPQPVIETPAPVVVEQPVTEPVAPDTSAGEEIDPDFVGTSSKIIEYEITYLDYDGTERTLDDYNGNKPFVRHL